MEREDTPDPQDERPPVKAGLVVILVGAFFTVLVAMGLAGVLALWGVLFVLVLEAL